jgi:hypothetical protein
VHRKYIYIYIYIHPTRCNFTQLLINCINHTTFLRLLIHFISNLTLSITVWQIPDAVNTVVCAPDDGWRYHPKHVEQIPDINKLCNVASCWIYIGIRDKQLMPTSFGYLYVKYTPVLKFQFIKKCFSMLNVDQLSCWHYFMFLKEHNCYLMLQQICVQLKCCFLSTNV